MSYLYLICLKHLNLTWLIGIIGVNVIIAITGGDAIIMTILALFINVPLTLWVLQQKNRSLSWFFLAWLGSPLWLKNKSQQQDNES